MKCLRKFKWIKLRRNCLPNGRGLLGYWARLAARAAFRKGKALYCGMNDDIAGAALTMGELFAAGALMLF